MEPAFPCFLQCGILEPGDGWELRLEAGDLHPFPLVCFHSRIWYFGYPTEMVSTGCRNTFAANQSVKLLPHFCLGGDKIHLLSSQKMAAFISAWSPAVPCWGPPALLQHSCLQLVSPNSSVPHRVPPPQMLGSAFCNSARPGFNQRLDENDGAQAIIRGVLKWTVWPWKSKCQHKQELWPLLHFQPHLKWKVSSCTVSGSGAHPYIS